MWSVNVWKMAIMTATSRCTNEDSACGSGASCCSGTEYVSPRSGIAPILQASVYYPAYTVGTAHTDVPFLLRFSR